MWAAEEEEIVDFVERFLLLILSLNEVDDELLQVERVMLQHRTMLFLMLMMLLLPTLSFWSS